MRKPSPQALQHEQDTRCHGILELKSARVTSLRADVRNGEVSAHGASSSPIAGLPMCASSERRLGRGQSQSISASQHAVHSAESPACLPPLQACLQEPSDSGSAAFGLACKLVRVHGVRAESKRRLAWINRAQLPDSADRNSPALHCCLAVLLEHCCMCRGHIHRAARGGTHHSIASLQVKASCSCI